MVDPTSVVVAYMALWLLCHTPTGTCNPAMVDRTVLVVACVTVAVACPCQKALVAPLALIREVRIVPNREV